MLAALGFFVNACPGLFALKHLPEKNWFVSCPGVSFCRWLVLCFISSDAVACLLLFITGLIFASDRFPLWPRFCFASVSSAVAFRGRHPLCFA